jgi:hypothetical protein
MRELFAQMNTALAAGGPDSPDVVRLVTAIEQQFPALAPIARAAREAARISRGQPASENVAGGTPGLMKYLPWALAALGLTGTTAAISGIDLTQINPDRLPQLPPVTNRWVLLGILAAVGAVVGVVHSAYRNGGLVLPKFAKDNASNMLTLSNYGFAGDLFWGATAAVASWLAHPVTTGQDGTGNLLQWNQVISAAVVAFAGATAWSGWRGNQIAKEALIQFIPPDLRGKAKNMSTPDVAMMATGMKIPGREPPPGAPTSPAEAEQDLFARLLDPQKLAALLPQLAKPPGPDGAGLTAGTLLALRGLLPGVQAAVQNVPLADITRMSREDFLTAAAAKGIDTAQCGDVLRSVHAGALEAMAKLRTMPTGWTLTADRLPSLTPR